MARIRRLLMYVGLAVVALFVLSMAFIRSCSLQEQNKELQEQPEAKNPATEKTTPTTPEPATEPKLVSPEHKNLDRTIQEAKNAAALAATERLKKSAGPKSGLISQDDRSDMEEQRLRLSEEISDLESLIDRRKGEFGTEKSVAEKMIGVVDANDNAIRRQVLKDMGKEIQRLQTQLRKKKAEFQKL